MIAIVTCAIAIETQVESLRTIAQTLARDGGMTVRATSNADELTLAMRDDGWELRDAACKPGRGFRMDFSHTVQQGSQRARRNLSRKQPLARAVGRDSRVVIDATAGLGHDAALLAAMGFTVIAMERHAVLHALLADALRRATEDEADRRIADALGNRLSIVHADARHAIPAVVAAAAVGIDCIYIDPMFPPKRKASALAKKNIRLVRALAGDDDDSASLVTIARQSCARVAVKRPHHAGPLAADVAAVIEGTLVRYDVYTGAP